MISVYMTGVLIACCISDQVPRDTVDQAPWALEVEIRIGAVDRPNYNLTHIGGLVVDDHGDMFVAQPRENLIRVYSEDGVFRRTIGGAGGGPGEFRDLAGIGLHDEGVWAADARESKVVTFSKSGEVLASSRIEVDMVPGLSSRPGRPTALLADGNYESVPYGSARAGAEHRQVPIHRAAPSGEIIDTLLVAGPPIERHRILHQGRAAHFVAPFPSRNIYTRNDRGSVIAAIEQTSADGADAAFIVRTVAVSAEGMIDRTAFSVRYLPRAVPAADRAAEISRITEMAVRLGMRRAEARQMVRDSISIPTHQPPVSDLVLGRDSTVWIRREDVGVRSVAWHVYDRSGRPLGGLSLPVGRRIIAADRRHVWAEIRDDLDVPYLIRYRIRRGG